MAVRPTGQAVSPAPLQPPATVSPVYANLFAYINRHPIYSAMTRGMRYSLFAAAYTAYSEDKKAVIRDNVAGLSAYYASNPSGSPTSSLIEQDVNVKFAFQRFDNDAAFERFCKTAERVVKGYIEQDIVTMMNGYIGSVRQKFWWLVLIHFTATIIVAFLVSIIPVLATIFGYEGPIRLLNSLGQYLIKTFPVPLH